MDEKDELIELRNKLIETERQLQEKCEENTQLKELNNVLSNKGANSSKGQYAKVLDEMYRLCLSDADAVISLIRNKTINVVDVDSKGKTLLLIASAAGSYQIVNLCLNLGADITHKDSKNHDAIYWAQQGAWSHVEQLLLFHKMDANVGNRVKNTAQYIKKQQGIIENISKSLSSYDSSTKQFFKDTVIDLMTNLISNKLSFSDDLLNLCWEFETENDANPLSSTLWTTLLGACHDVIQNGNKLDWHWLKTFVLPSAIWLHKDHHGDDRRYLHFKLVKLVEQQANEQLNELKDNLNALADKNPTDWDELVKFDICEQYDVARQDRVPNGIVPKFTFQQLSQQNASSSSFNSIAFYDYHEYLPQLILLAHIVDEDFQKSIQNIFNIHKSTNIGHIIDINGTIQYMRGPVKLMDRARSKGDDYNHEAYPTSACILDLNRCSLIFNDIATLLSALELFRNKIKYYQSGCIIDIVRDKNGFQEYVKSAQYADIKLNVLIKGKSNNIIGEVQFLLRTMKEYKDKAHSLYAITRDKEYYETSVSSILPILLNHDQQVFVAGNMGDVKALCDLMVVNNKTVEDVMKVDEESGESILVNICAFCHLKAFKFLETVVSKDVFIERLFLSNRYNTNGIEALIECGNDPMLKHILCIDAVRETYNYKNDKNSFWRLLFWLWTAGTCSVIDWVKNDMKITHEQNLEMMSHKYTKTLLTSLQVSAGSSAFQYHKCNILNMTVRRNTLDVVQKLVSSIGKKTFCELAFNADSWDVNALEEGVRYNKLKIIKYLLGLDQIKNAYANTESLQWRLLFWLFTYSFVLEETIDYVLTELNISNEKIIELLDYKYKQTLAFTDDAFQYHDYTILSRLTWKDDPPKLRKLLSFIGEKAFTERIFVADNCNINGLEYCIRKKKMEMMKYIMSFDEIRDKCANDMEIKFRMVWWMSRKYDKTISDYIVNTLKLDALQLKELQSFKCPKPNEGEFGSGTDTRTYWDKTISDKAISKIMKIETQ
eukprot:207222_1